MVALPYHHGMPEAGRTQTLKKSPSFLLVYFEFHFIIHLISSFLTAVGQAHHYTGLRNQLSLKPRLFQQGTFKIIYEHFQYCYKIIPSSIPCYCRTKQSWNSLGLYNFNEIINDIMIFHENFSSHLFFVVIVFNFAWVFFLFCLWGTHRDIWKQIHPSLTSQKENPCPVISFLFR